MKYQNGYRIPHMYGDDPTDYMWDNMTEECSPDMWIILMTGPYIPIVYNVPLMYGDIPLNVKYINIPVPRVFGDDPSRLQLVKNNLVCSHNTWGCSCTTFWL